MTSVKSMRLALALAAAAALGACGSPARAPEPAPAPPPAPVAVAPQTGAILQAFESQQRARAEAALRQDRLPDALLAWDALLALRPADEAYLAKRAATTQRAEALAADRIAQAKAAQRRGDTAGAMQHYLDALAALPTHAAAADALRAIERERNRRTYLGKYSRNTLQRHPPDRAAAARPAPSPDVRAGGDRNDLEHASMLAAQGELADAIALLKAHLATKPQDAPARQLLATLLEQQARPQRNGTAPVAPATPAR